LLSKFNLHRYVEAVMEEKVSTTNVDMSSVTPKYKRYSKDEIKEIIDRL
jgi:hypothetical protein